MKKSCADLFLWNKSAENYISSQKISDFAKVNQLIVANQSYFLRPAACLGSLTAETTKNPCRPHKAYIFLSNFFRFIVAIYGYMWYNKD